jgi:glycosyltransferase involved in cell wall biosynthesis
VVKTVRVLQVLGGTGRGGVETWLLRVLPHVQASGIQVDILVHGLDEEGYLGDFRRLGCAILDGGDHRRPWSYMPRFRGLLRRHGPYDIVHDHMYLLSGLHLLLARGSGVPHRIAHIHPASDVRAGAWMRPLYRRSMSDLIATHATCLLFPSQSSRSAWCALGGFSRLPQDVVPNCIERPAVRHAGERERTRQELKLPVDRPLVVFVGRFVAHKNHALAFAIADELARRGLRVHVALAGSHGDRLGDVQARAKARSDFSVLVGLTDIGPLMASADAFLLPSLEEGFGVVALEAQAAGLPVVASDLPAIREAVTPGMHELLFPANDPHAAASRLALILGDAELRRRLAEEGLGFAARFTAAASAGALLSAYRRHCAPLFLAPQAGGSAPLGAPPS